MAQQDRRASRIESEYYAHMGFDPEHQREVLRFYVPMFAEPVVYPGVGDLVGSAMRKLAASVEPRPGAASASGEPLQGATEGRERSGEASQGPPSGPAGPEGPDPSWAYELAHVVSVLGDRLQEATQALREPRSAYDNLVWGLYQGNETFVVARG